MTKETGDALKGIIDGDSGDFLSMTCEEAIAALSKYMKEIEVRKQLHNKYAPSVIPRYIDALGRGAGRANSLIQKCLLRHGTILLEDKPEIKEINRVYNRINKAMSSDADGYEHLSLLVDSMSTSISYSYASGGTTVVYQLDSDEETMGRLAHMCKGLQINTPVLGIIAMMASMSKSKEKGISKTMGAELIRFDKFLELRTSLMEKYIDVASKWLPDFEW